jgi:hypothetical protein
MALMRGGNAMVAREGAERWLFTFLSWLVTNGDTPPRVFLQKSVELIENKGVDVFESDKEFARV